MSTNGVNSVDEADISECDGEKVVTMMDVLQEQQEFEEDANAVLGASDDKECTYPKGYIKRQAIYACLTCCSGAKDDPTQRAGVCLACSLNCHENHELIELYTKRNFRCDCGNPKFNSHPCQFTSNKTELNEENNYNQNFSGIYCICNRPYPDPEATVEDEMIQCIICEDWLHSNHLEAVVPAHDLYAEMICKACMDKNDFLHDYSQLAVNYEVEVDVSTVNEADINLVNGNKAMANTGDIDMENGEADVTEMITPNETIDEAQKTDEENTHSIDSTTNNPQLESTSCSVINSEDNIKADQQETQVVKEIVNDETQSPDLKPSEAITSQSEFVETDNKSEDDKELPKPSYEQNEENKTDSAVQELKITDKTNIKTNEMSNECDGDIKEHTPVESNSSSEPTDNISKEVTDNIKTEVSSKPSNECEVDSLEAATQELSKLVADDAEIKQTSNDLEKKKPNEVQNEQTSTPELHPTPNENGLKDENKDDASNKNNLENKNIMNITENDHKRKLDDTSKDVSVKKQKLDKNEDCLRPRNFKRIIKGAAFWPPNFRQKLCTCNECLSMYKDLSLLFLIDQEDTVTAYETLGKEKIDGGPTTQYEKGLQALSSLDRVQQINALTEYNKMRDKLLDFLKSFKDRKEIVKEEDIKAFFAGMKPKREPDGVYFCR